MVYSHSHLCSAIYTTGKSFLGVTIEDDIDRDEDKISEIKRLIRLCYLKRGHLPFSENIINELADFDNVGHDLFTKKEGSIFKVSIHSANNIMIK